MKQTSVVAAVLVVSIGTSLSAQQGTASKIVALPESVHLSDAEIQWQSGGGDGCASDDCSYYRITVRGDGLVTLSDLGWGERLSKWPTRQRSIPADSVVALLDECLKVRFFESPDNFKGRRVAVRKGDSLFLYSSVGGVGARWVDLTVRLGAATKTVRLEEETPRDLARLRDRIFEIGGPKAPWPVQ